MADEIKKYEKKELEKQEIKSEAKIEVKSEPKKDEQKRPEPTVAKTAKTLKTFWSRLKRKNPKKIDMVIKKEAEKQEVQRQELLKKSEISVWLDNYDDVFSDFDPRPYSQRAISDDFVRESQKMAKETRTGKFQLHLMIPSASRNEEHENMVKKRLKEYFKGNLKLIEQEIRAVKKEGIYLAFFGAVLLSIATLIAFIESKMIPLLILLTILEPAGWFTMWTGLDRIFYETRKKKPELDFNLKMAASEINFVSY